MTHMSSLLLSTVHGFVWLETHVYAESIRRRPKLGHGQCGRRELGNVSRSAVVNRSEQRLSVTVGVPVPCS